MSYEINILAGRVKTIQIGKVLDVWIFLILRITKYMSDNEKNKIF